MTWFGGQALLREREEQKQRRADEEILRLWEMLKDEPLSSIALGTIASEFPILRDKIRVKLGQG